VFSVSTVPPNNKPVFTDTGMHSGSCTLVCHGVTHDNRAYPVGSPGALRPQRAVPLRR